MRNISKIEAQSEVDESLEYDDRRAHAERCTYIVLRI